MVSLRKIPGVGSGVDGAKTVAGKLTWLASCERRILRQLMLAVAGDWQEGRGVVWFSRWLAKFNAHEPWIALG
jgi:hypothetical protein